MKICYIIHGFQIGGAEKIVADYLVELKRQGHDVFAVTLDARKFFLSEQLRNQNIPIFHLAPYIINNRVSLISRVILHKLNKYTCIFDKKLSTIIEREQPDIIHWHTNICYDSLLTLPKKYQFFTFHADVKRYLNLFSNSEKAKLIDYVNHGLNIVVLNETMLCDANEMFENASIALIPNGLPLSTIRKNKYNKPTFCASLKIPEDAFILTMVGRFHPVKNQEWAIEVFSEVIKKCPKAYLLFVGQEDNAIRKNIEERMSAINIPSDRVIFLGLRQDATSILSISDACIVPSYSESFSLVAVEAQVFNVRVISSDAIPNSVLRNSNTIALSLKDNAEIWANAVLSKDVDTTKTGSIEDFDITNVINKHVQLYNKCLCQ